MAVILIIWWNATVSPFPFVLISFGGTAFPKSYLGERCFPVLPLDYITGCFIVFSMSSLAFLISFSVPVNVLFLANKILKFKQIRFNTQNYPSIVDHLKV